MLEYFVQIAQWVGWAPVALILAVAIVGGLFLFRERDTTRIARIQYLEERLKDYNAESPIAAVSRLRQTLKINDKEMAQLTEKGKQAAENYEREIGQISEAKTQAEARAAALERLRQEKEQEDAARSLRFAELKGERDAALAEAAVLREQLTQASGSLNEFTVPHSGHFDDQIAEAILWPGQDDNCIYLTVRTGYPQSAGKDEERQADMKRLQETSETGGMILRIYRDGISKMSVLVEALNGEIAGWIQNPDQHWYTNDFNKTVIAILGFADSRWLPTNDETMLRARIEIRNVRFQGVSPIDPRLAYLRVKMTVDNATIRDRAPHVIDKVQ